jgi:hypothetical protein
MANETIAKPLRLITDLKILVHEIPYAMTFIVIQNSVLDSNYFMLLGRPWLKDDRYFRPYTCWKVNTTQVLLNFTMTCQTQFWIVDHTSYGNYHKMGNNKLCIYLTLGTTAFIGTILKQF